MKKRIISSLLIFLLILGVSFTSGSSVSRTEAAKKITISKQKVTLTKGSSITLKIKGTKKKVTWSSSKKKVAVVSKKGKVTAKKKGQAKITAKVGKKKYTCQVKVVKQKKQKTNTASSTTTATPQTPSDSTQGQATGTPSEESKQADAGEYSLDTVHTGEATYYNRVSTGAANLDDYESIYDTAAMNNEDYMNGLAGAYVEITDKDGDKLNVLITDRLPEGKKGDIDLSRTAFSKIEPLVTGRMQIQWKIIPLPTIEPISYVFKPTSSQYWAEVQVRNGRYPIRSLEYYDGTSGQYVALERQEYNYFTAPSGMGTGPYTFRVTDFYGHVLVDSGIQMNTSGTPVKGSGNFPY